MKSATFFFTKNSFLPFIITQPYHNNKKKLRWIKKIFPIKSILALDFQINYSKLPKSINELQKITFLGCIFFYL